MKRRDTLNFKIGSVGIGSKYPISIQSMTNTDTRNAEKTLAQIKELSSNGCEIIRVAVPDDIAATSLKKICMESPIPVIADIHFDYKLALKAMENGVHALRINPGNIGSELKVKEVVESAKYYDIPIRIGVNAGSLEKGLLEKYGVTPEAMIESALYHINLLERQNFNKIKISLKSSNVPLMIDTYKKIANQIPYPLHIGVTEAGTMKGGTIKSSIGIGALLSDGIGDTIRVSLTGNPLLELPVAKQILVSLGLKKQGVEIISCPTCGRTEIDLEYLANEVEKYTANMKENLKIAVMGCVVNGPGEAKEADLGIAGGKGQGLIFKKGEIIAKVKEDELLSTLYKEIEDMRRCFKNENE
ncbi:flavodoxin-dependent (E)-4-hydroxy-3-methylbut-2-enyl-diphosphate synthase [Desulfonispora thiosulfatigenes]|uniref:flavodoxin-dependent (E)-4-hydroxy-3-methylbut-2-enyl-diphosphate synthase n=1 Tax=Desulfonispora thiosulfatigenes TaxID=83661 RepID=UPI0009FD9FF3